MKYLAVRTCCWFFQCLLVLTVTACSSTPYRPEPLDDFHLEQRALTQQQGAIRVSTSVLSPQEAERLFDIAMYQRGIQPVWLEIRNDGDTRARLILSSLDPQYFSPYEVAYMHKKQFSKQGWKDLEKSLYDNAIPRQIGPHQTVSGFVFTHAVKGTKAFNVEVFYATKALAYEQFTFFVEVPGFVPDHAEVDFKKLYSADEIREVDDSELNTRIEELPCCTTNHDRSEPGRPANLYMVANGRDLLRGLLRAGWAETSYKRDDRYLAAADYLFGRPPDAIFRKGRDKATERIELGLWLTPILVDGKPLWAAQMKHAIGRRYEIGEQFLSVKLDPDVNDGRNFLLQDLWYAQSLQHWAWVASGISAPQESPGLDLNGNPWFVDDGNSVVIWVSGQPVALQDATQIHWGEEVTVPGGQQ